VTLTPLFALFEFNMTNQNLLPLYDRILLKYTFSRVMDSITLFFLILLLGYRGYCIFYTNNYTFPCFVALFCESWFTFTWILTMNLKWNPAYTITHLDRLLLRYIYCYAFNYCMLQFFMIYFMDKVTNITWNTHTIVRYISVETHRKCSIRQYRLLYLKWAFWIKSYFFKITFNRLY
jgi:hypothetical protein